MKRERENEKKCFDVVPRVDILDYKISDNNLIQCRMTSRQDLMSRCSERDGFHGDNAATAASKKVIWVSNGEQ